MLGPLEITEKVRRNAALVGDAGRAWIADLPLLISELEARWAIKVKASVQRASEAFVAEACTNDGLEVIVKIVVPGIDQARQELRILRRAQGLGYARLIRCDEVNNAMLLEKLGPQLHQFDVSGDARIQVIATTLRKAWLTPQPEGPSLITGAEKAVEFCRLIESNWQSLDRPCSERTIELALSYAERRRRAFDPAQSVLAHGDAHEWNTLRASGNGTGFKFVDPDGAFAERAFDLGIPMREWGDVTPEGNRLQLGRRRCLQLSQVTGAEAQAIWEWGFVQCVSNGLSLLRIGLKTPAAVEFAMADAWAAEPGPMF